MYFYDNPQGGQGNKIVRSRRRFFPTCLLVCCLLVQGKLQAFLAVASQTLESFGRSLDEAVKTPAEDHNSQEHQFVLALAGTITSERCHLNKRVVTPA